MRMTSLLVGALLAGTALAQMPVPAFGSTFTSTLTRGFWFQAPGPAVITGLSVPNEAVQPFQVVEVIDLGTTAPPAYPGTVVGTTLFYDNTTAGGSLIPTSIPLVPGNFYGVLGACNPAVGSTTSYNSYAGVAGAFTSDFLGIPTTITRFGTQFGIGAGGGQPCWSEAAGSIARVDVYLSPASGSFATNTTLGASCGSSSGSFYELFPTAATASTTLSGNSLQLIPTGTGYQGIWLPGTAAAFYHTPVAPTTLATGDDGVVVYNISSGTLPTPYGAQTALQVSGNGILGFGATGLDYPGTSSYTPTNAGFNNSTSGGIYSWHDFNSGEAGSGPINAEEVGGVLYVSFVGVENYSATTTPNPSTLQFQLDLASGIVTIVWVSIDGDTTSAFGSAHLVGVSAPGASVDLGSVSLATGTPAQLASGADVTPSVLAATTRPVLGTNWNLNASNITPTTVFGVTLWGTADPGVLDLFFLGMPGCQLRSTLDVIEGPWLPAAGSHPYSFAVPATPLSLVGFQLFTQVATFDAVPVNAFGAITTNGIKGLLGDV